MLGLTRQTKEANFQLKNDALSTYQVIQLRAQ